MKIGGQIKKYRAEMKFSQDQLAEKIFVSRQTISNWENNKNYPDVKSLLLLSSLFDVTLDILVKGDIEEMKEKIKTEDIVGFKHESNIFSILFLCMIVLPVPIVKFIGNIGVVIWLGIAIVTMYYAIRVEKLKKNFNVQTYREIIAFLDGENINEVEKNQEYGKRSYQKFLLAVGSGISAIMIALMMWFILF